MKKRLHTFTIPFLSILLFGGTAGYAQTVGGPYEPDENTILLLHFDGDIANTATAFEVGAPIGNGTLREVGPADFIRDNRLPEGLGQQVYVDNLSSVDSTYIAIPDTAALDLTGDWTMEYWVNVFSYGTSNTAHNFHPRVLMKRGPLEAEPEVVEANFWNNLSGSLQNFITGYHTRQGNVSIGSPSGMFETNNWYHVAFIRDTRKMVVAQLIHWMNPDTGETELIHFQTNSFADNPAPPAINKGSLFIGGFPDIANSWLNGSLDELRISNIVRNFAAPPIVIATDLENQQPGTGPFEVEAIVSTLGEESIASVTLHVDTGSGLQEIPMTATVTDSLYTGSISQLPAGTTVSYYVSATTAGGLSSTSPQSELGSDRPDILYQFAVVEPESQVLHLTFEEGQGTPVDHSAMNHRVQVFGNPTYSTDAIKGQYSLHFAEGDSSYLMIDPSPALSSEEFLVDFWFKLDSVTTNGRFIVKQGSDLDPGPVFHINYKIFTFGSDQSIRAASKQKDGGLNGGRLDPEVVPDTDTWYRATYFMSVDTTYFQMRTEAGSVVAEAGYASDELPALATNGPLFIGFATEPGSNFFLGKMDDIKIFNYPKQPAGTRVTGSTKLVGTMATADGPYEVQTTLESDLAVTATLVYRTNGSDFQEVAMAPSGADTYTGEIPTQEAGTVVEYYTVVEDEAGVRQTRPAQAETGDPRYYHFGVGETEGQMLHLTFEEGSGIPQNHGLYSMPIVLDGKNGTPSYSGDAREGSFSLQFSEADSSYLIIDPSPFLASEEFLLDFWFKPESPMERNDFLVAKTGGEGITERTNHINYKAFALGSSAALRGASWQKGGGLNGGKVDTGVSPEPGNWYRAIYFMSADTAYFAYYKEDGTLVGEAGYSAPALPATATYGPFYIGFANEGNAGFFDGKIDDVKFYNFAKQPEGLILSVDDDHGLPITYELSQNYPNPFNPATRIKYALPKTEAVMLVVYDVLGREVMLLVDGQQRAGYHEVVFDGNALASGVYLYRLQAGDVVKTKKMLLIK